MNYEKLITKIMSKDLLFISDSQSTLQYVRKLGFEGEEYNHRPIHNDALVMLCHPHNSQHFLNREDIDSITLNIILNKFMCSESEEHYTIDALLDTNFLDSITRRKIAYERFFSSDRCEVISACGDKLKLHINEQIEIANNDEYLTPGWLYTVSELLEAAIFNQTCPRSSFSAEGRFVFDSVLHLYSKEEAKVHMPMMRLWQKEAAKGGGFVDVKHNQIVNIEINGINITDSFLSMCSREERGAEVLEFALGCATRNSGVINGYMNSPLNEGIKGIHLGIGMGRYIPHIDFISRSAKARFY
ncbi:hypothetical protein R7E49_23050 [Vibrio sp. Vb2110]|uniref:hypothetical protein n=1 Tax=unclassified Vibrio TaxID=2614977 RepID=UPI002964FE00|nr:MULTISPECIES: hypothetical protein [unclassified Vibrio]MDG3414600.1 hypothetical protein [Vibrio parahaemolyticus]MDW1848673.1 hypothetical protein [Vibrio sp. Vb2130]MDW1882788.1 hypothetical protein [Vibrio sp. Vb2110]MDW2040870.1 hypothetical protein [Vibrio sp. 2130-1]MDW2137836.1 hypothetical protein [Vibrio sp. 2128(2023)]